MTRKDREKLNQCNQSGCQYFEHCLIYHGNQCKRLDGDKIPRMRHPGEVRASSVQQLSSSFKPYFMASSEGESEAI